MKRGLLIIGLMVALFSMAGCKAGGVIIQDNVYNALGGHTLKIADSFTYLGEVDPSVMVSSNGDRAKKSNHVKTRGDVFVKSIDGKVTEVVVLQRLKVTGNWLWNASGGEVVEMDGKKYKETFYIIREGSDITTDAYAKHIADNGYTFADDYFIVRDLVRNSGNQLRVAILYALAPSEFPSSVSDRREEIREYLRERFAEAVTTP